MILLVYIFPRGEIVVNFLHGSVLWVAGDMVLEMVRQGR
jgi:hypothetical protein